MIRGLFIAGTIVWVAAMVLVYSDAGSGIAAMFGFMGGVAVLTVVVIVQLLLGVLRRRGTIADTRFRGRWQLVAPVALAVAMAMAVQAGPRGPLFKLRFALSEHALETRARALVASTFHSTTPEWIGLFRVLRITAQDNQVRFITTPCGVVDSCGVVYAPSGSPSRWMEDQFRPLHGAWWHVFEGF